MATTDTSIDDLQLDLKNPRFDGLANQRQALERIVFSQGRKLVNLADDIATEGISPAHRMLVVRARERGKFTVLDGNRRVAALRVLVNPSVLDGMEEVGDSTKKALKAIAKRFDRTSVEPIDVYLLDNEQVARHWIEAIHTGENEGRGVVNWDGIARARFRGQSASLKALSLVESKGKLTESELASLEKFPITNLDRMLATPEVRDRLGLVLEEGNLFSDVGATDLVRALKRIVMDIATKKTRVSHIDTKADRMRYMDKIKAVLPDLSKRSGTMVPIDSLAAGTTAGASAAARVRRRSLTKRKAIIASDFRLHIDDPKIEEIYVELRKLPLEAYPNAIGALARVFIELSCDHYGDSKKIAGYSIDWTLKKKIDQVAAHLQSAGVNRRDLQAFRRLASSPDVALGVDRLHGIIHSRYELPTPTELRRGWDEIRHVFLRVWPEPKKS